MTPMSPTGRIVVTGSVAFDYLMTFPGRFTEHLIPDRMDRLSISFLVDEMRRVPGGCGPNIAYGLSILGEPRPILMATAGSDAAEYREHLGRQGVDVSHLRLESDLFTASFFVSTDQAQNQLASFYTGAMSRARQLSLRALEGESLAFVVISPNDPPAMAQYTEDCRRLSIPFLYDPSQQVTRLSGEEMREGFRGAAILIVNDYEFGILTNKTGMGGDALAESVPVLIVTHGPDGSTIYTRDEQGRHRRARDSGGEGRGRGRGPDRCRRPVPGGPAARAANRRPVARGGPDRGRGRGLRTGDAGARSRPGSPRRPS